jgi:hypothetical protein
MAHRKKIRKKRRTVEKVERPSRIRRYKYYFLIICEDQKTEPTYFSSFKEKFPKRTLYLESIGTGRDPLGVVEQSIVEKKRLENQIQKKIDTVWVVFDKDDADLSEGKLRRFTQAYSLAEEKDIEIALSNEVFELWLLLHFEDVDGRQPIPRKDVYERLELAINDVLDEGESFVYEHGKSEVIAYVLTLGNEENASKRAIVLRNMDQEKNPIECNPSTDVDLLVSELRGWIKYYNPEG